MRLSWLPSASGFQTAALFLFDGLANLTDFAFHFWMGRVLVPSDFAVLQTLNSVILVYTTASGVFQPVVSRFVAEARGREQDDVIPAIFQSFLRAALLLGLLFACIFFLFSGGIAQAFNLPKWTIQISAALIFLSTLRPIASGILQGREQFLSFGLSRLIIALGRLLFAALLVYYGFALHGVIIAYPLGWLAGVTIAFIFLGSPIWLKSKPAPEGLLGDGWKLSVYALLAFAAFMSMTSIDLIWVNRNLPGELAGAYASLVLFRRVVALLPGVAVVIMFPRVAKLLAEGNLPDQLLFRTSLIIVTAGGLLTLLYFVFDQQIVSFIIGRSYLPASPLLGWMGFSMVGVSLSSIWLNFYLAHRPRGFIMLLGLAILLEWILLNVTGPSMQNAVIAFGTTGWSLAIGGLLLYLFHYRKELANA